MQLIRPEDIFFDMKDKRVIRYLSVKDGNISVEYTDDFIQVMKKEFNGFFDTTDNLFERISGYPGVCEGYEFL